MNINDIINSFINSLSLESISKDRDGFIILLLHKIKENNFNKQDIGFDEINLIVEVISVKKKNKIMDDLNNKLLYLDIVEFIRLIFNETEKKEEVKLVIKEEIKEEMQIKKVYINDEEDVLDQEGFMTPLKTGPTYLDKEYAKLLGITDE